MANYKIDAVFEMRKYLWDALAAEGIFVERDYYSDNIGENVVPIVPVQQSPEMNQFLSGKKHIVYDKIGMSYDDLWLVCNEQVLFTIYATEYIEVNEIKNFMIDMFRRMDETAKDLNRGGINQKFKFHSIYISDVSPTSPSEELKGFLSSDVILEVKYSRETNQAGRFT